MEDEKSRQILSTIRGLNDSKTPTSTNAKEESEKVLFKNIACFYCFKKHRSVLLLKQHFLKEQHDENHDACCTSCGKMCKTYFRLREHLLGATASRPCKEAFETRGGCRKCLRIPEEGRVGGAHACAFNSSNSSSRRGLEVGECAPHVAIDCEMIETTNSEETLAKICVVNGSDESVLMETLVTFHGKHDDGEEVKVLDYRTEITGLTARDWEGTKALPTLSEAREEVLACLAGAHEKTPTIWKNKPHKLVVHDARHDLRALEITEQDVPNLSDRIRDTSTYVPLQKEKGKRVKLKKLVEQFLQEAADDDTSPLRDFQSQYAPHSPRLDALAALRLYQGCRDNCSHFRAVRKGPSSRRGGGAAEGGEEEKIEYLKTVPLDDETSAGEMKEESETNASSFSRCWCEDSINVLANSEDNP